MADLSEATTGASGPDSTEIGGKVGEKKREIKGGLPYSTSPGSFKKSLDGIITAERPERFSGDFLATILKISGGSARPIPPMLKKMNFITSDGTPTDLYSKFKSDSARGQAALDGLKNAYGEMFRRNDFIHRADENVVRDLIVEITGLKKSDNIIRMIYQTFDAIRSFSDKSASPSQDSGSVGLSNGDINSDLSGSFSPLPNGQGRLGLSYHINIVLPETENIAVFNAIFRSLRENIL
ncbi:hypothetical protein BV97_03529 [Novosphingobium resinovorum]|jgi:hypothetical protein|uniref:DUF5343 domain-containing protein n=1 Tax=Novosphingobium resinovorum TaxID=158500 RepID=A0A031JVN9_9SPHN|nr:DUF5343 domain-containing protein [Novosphingobium resinovorum]EZP80442.1 hypothetical protein BV97_03529 [Novosphingobium resinovorum]